MHPSTVVPLGIISVVFENRPDGGLRVYCDDVPGFILSHPDAEAVMRDVKPALETILGDMLGRPVTVTPRDKNSALPWFQPGERETRQYEAKAAA